MYKKFTFLKCPLCLFSITSFRIWRLYAPIMKKRSDYFTSNFVSRQCLATCCQDDTVSSLIWDTRLGHIHQLLFFQATGQILCQKTFRCKGEVKTVFKDFLESNPLYCTSVNNLFNWWQKCIDVHKSYFDGLKHFLNSLIYK